MFFIFLSPSYKIKITYPKMSRSHTENVFSHPDYTVGSGISPDQPLKWVMDFTIGRDLHPATKTLFYFEKQVNDEHHLHL